MNRCRTKKPETFQAVSINQTFTVRLGNYFEEFYFVGRYSRHDCQRLLRIVRIESYRAVLSTGNRFHHLPGERKLIMIVMLKPDAINGASFVSVGALSGYFSCFVYFLLFLLALIVLHIITFTSDLRLSSII